MELKEQAEKIIGKLNEMKSGTTFVSEKQEKYYNHLFEGFVKSMILQELESAESMGDTFSEMFECMSGIDADEFDEDLEEWNLDSALELIDRAFTDVSYAIDFMKGTWRC